MPKKALYYINNHPHLHKIIVKHVNFYSQNKSLINLNKNL